MATTMYRVGDYVYVETTPGSPYLIRRIEELNKNQTGNVEAKMMCFYRRRDLPNPLVQLADKHQLATAEDSPLAMKLKKTWLRTPVGEEQAAQAVLDPSIAALDEDRTSPTQNSTNTTTTAATTTGGTGTSSSATATTTATGSVTTSGGSSGTAEATKNATTNSNANANDSKGGESLTSKQRYQIKQRELFLSRQVETLPATQIRGKCSVTLLNETESLQSYLNKDDTFFYCLVFDPNQKTLLADKGEIRVGSRYQSEIPAKLKDTSTDDRKLEELETLVWTPQHELNDRKIDQFLVVSRSIGTFARALDCSSSVKQPSLHMSAAAASRDITLFHAMDLLHQQNYSIEEAMCSLVPSSGPVLCRDEIEDWSASEANLFEEALDKYGKDFNDIRQDFLPWKTLKQIIEYYYMWKTTDRYVQQKRVKAVEAELKLKQVYVPHYNNNNNNNNTNNNNNNNNKSAMNAAIALNAANALKNSGVSIYNGTSNSLTGTTATATNGGANDFLNNGKPCESCASNKSSQWHPWTTGNLTCRLCQTCWDYWKKYGGLKMIVKHNNNNTNNNIENSSNATSNNNSDNSADLKKKLASQMTVELIGNNIACGAGGNISGGLAAAANLAGISVIIADEDKVSDLSSRQLHKCSIVNCGKEFKLKTHLARHYAQAHGIALSSNSPRPIMKTRTAFYLHANAMTRLARILCRELIKPRRAARQTSYAINTQLIKQEFGTRVVGKTAVEMKILLQLKKKNRGSVTKIANRLGSPGIGPHEWLILTPRDKMPLPDVVYFPKPPKGPDGSLLYERIPNKIPDLDKDLTIMPANLAVATSHQALRKRMHEHHEQQLNGTDVTIVPTGPPLKRPNKDPMPSHCPSPEQFAAMMAASGQPLTRHHLNGKPKIAQMARIGNGRKQVISWMDAPDDVYFRATKASKRARQILAPVDVRRAARKPWRNLSIKPIMLGGGVTNNNNNNNNSRPMDSQVVILD